MANYLLIVNVRKYIFSIELRCYQKDNNAI